LLEARLARSKEVVFELNFIELTFEMYFQLLTIKLFSSARKTGQLKFCKTDGGNSLSPNKGGL